MVQEKNEKELNKKSNTKSIKFKSLEGKLLLIKVGNDSRPAGENEIKDLENKMVTLLEENDINCAVLVANHTVSVEIIG